MAYLRNEGGIGIQGISMIQGGGWRIQISPKMQEVQNSGKYNLGENSDFIRKAMEDHKSFVGREIY